MPRTTDPRVIRTRQMLREAIISLILEKGYDTITIQDITDAAGLRRATFYLHYRDKEELIVSILRETFDELVEQIEKLGSALIPQNQYQMNLIMFAHAQANARLYQSILSGYGATTITRYVRDYLAEKFTEELRATIDLSDTNIPLEVVAAFAASMKLNLALWWLESGTPYTAEHMAEMLTHLTLNGIPRTIRNES